MGAGLGVAALVSMRQNPLIPWSAVFGGALLTGGAVYLAQGHS